ncbi:MAG: hypothetical protein KME04_14535 [Pleurocapsa minor GSE-CHR-MK-17-07R]|nr:hypothetical protein [Pleurocapsa minor GSE-CHR-MK 17-07R]
MKRWIAGLALVMALAGGSVMAQDEVYTPMGDITGNAGVYFGQTVQMEGFIDRFVSTNAFVLTDAAPLGANNVLVINNSGQPIPNSFVIGQEIVLTGRVHPSFNDVYNGAVMRYPSAFEERMLTMAPELLNTPDPAMMATSDPMMATPDPMVATTDPMMVTPDALMATPDPMMATVDPMVTAEAVPQDNVADPMAVTQVQPPSETGAADTSFSGQAPWNEDLLAWVYNETLPDEFDGYIIVELTDISLLTYPADS